VTKLLILISLILTCDLTCLVPFDEDERDPNVWFLDHDYLENMYAMFKKVNGKFGKYRFIPQLIPFKKFIISLTYVLHYIVEINKNCCVSCI
jgi:hypothetical protein